MVKKRRILAALAKIRVANFFFFFSKIWLRQSLDIMVSYYHVQYQKKLMIQSWRTDGRTDRSVNRKWIKTKIMTQNITFPLKKITCFTRVVWDIENLCASVIFCSPKSICACAGMCTPLQARTELLKALVSQKQHHEKWKT